MPELLERAAGAGDRIGPYFIREKLGEGGMGVVYRAEQLAPIVRSVALKLIKPGLETERILARFESERQVLSLLDHPHIARVLDAGVTRHGRSYFAMEYVPGESITVFCNRHRLDLRARLELFLKVCDAVHHAHQNSVIHRDLKPSNILVRLVDGEAVPKVIDFGVAKALAPGHGPVITLTEVGQLVGTPGYMSPEQAASPECEVDTRTDVYSLGAVLYELLAGAPLYEYDGSRDPERIRRELALQQPLRPSDRARRIRDRPQREGRRPSEGPPLPARRLRGDLDSIVMKAIQGDRDRRYDSVSILSAELRRHLRGDPIEARLPGAVYRLVRFADRHRLVVVPVLGLVLIALGFSIVTAIQARKLARERDRAEHLVDLMTHLYEVPLFVPGRHHLPAAQHILAGGARLIGTRLAGEPILEARLQHAMGVSLRNIGDPAGGASLLEQARSSLIEQLGAEHENSLSAGHDLAQAYALLGRLPEAESLLTETLEARRRVLGPGHADTLRTASALAMHYKSQRRPSMAAELFGLSLEGMRAALGEEDPETLLTEALLASVQLDLGLLDSAEALLRHAIPRMVDSHPERPLANYNLVCVLARQGRETEALALLRDTRGTGFGMHARRDPHLRSLHHYPEFEDIFKRASLLEPNILADLEWKASELLHSGRTREAEALYQHLLDHVPEDVFHRYRFAGDLVRLYRRQGRVEEAAQLVERRVELRRRERGAESVPVAVEMFGLAQIQLEAGKVGEAAATLREAGSIMERVPLAHSDVYPRLWATYIRGSLAALEGNQEEALRYLRDAVQAGFPNVRIVREDLALRPLRDSPEFQSLLARVEGRFEYP
ncbi:MAG: protein kinase domain-containing protein [Candidatus Polarisedimenticolia bacterium]